LGQRELSILGVALDIPGREEKGGHGHGGLFTAMNIIGIAVEGRDSIVLLLDVRGHRNPSAGLDISEMEEAEHWVEIRLEDVEGSLVLEQLEMRLGFFIEEDGAYAAPCGERTDLDACEGKLFAVGESEENFSPNETDLEIEFAVWELQGIIFGCTNGKLEAFLEQPLGVFGAEWTLDIVEWFEAFDIYTDGIAGRSCSEEMDNHALTEGGCRRGAALTPRSDLIVFCVGVVVGNITDLSGRLGFDLDLEILGERI
jgi:hypothetical protein